jgi:hypothetical protein
MDHSTSIGIYRIQATFSVVHADGHERACASVALSTSMSYDARRLLSGSDGECGPRHFIDIYQKFVMKLRLSCLGTLCENFTSK